MGGSRTDKKQVSEPAIHATSKQIQLFLERESKKEGKRKGESTESQSSNEKKQSINAYR